MDIYAPFKKYDYILNNNRIILAERIISLLELWNKIGEYDFSSTNLKSIVHLVDWATLHTINVTLTAEWQLYIEVFRNDMIEVVEKANKHFIEINPSFKSRFQKLIHVIINTWNHPSLEKFMKISNPDLCKEDIDFFNFEQAHLISVRLMKLCESNCEDLALNLSTGFLKYIKTEKFDKNIKMTADQVWFIFDVRITLLYKFKQLQKLADMLRILNNEDGVYFINRFINKKPNLLKIWKYSPKIAVLAVQTFLDKIVNSDRTDVTMLTTFLEIYMTLSSSAESIDFCTKIKKFCEASDSFILHVFCDFFKKAKNPNLKSFIVEIFIKTLTADMNELEMHKDALNLMEVATVTSRLAMVFCNLAEFMDDKIKVARECILTAFSLEPTAERLRYLEVLAEKSGLQISNSSYDWTCKLHPPVLPTDGEINWQCPECHQYMCKPQLDIPLTANLALNEAIQTLDLSETLCEDLIVCISNPRYQILSWYLPWTVLHRLCLMYFKDPQATKNYVTELKYVDIDYSMFEGIQRDPFEEYGGIEKGYEKYLDKNFIPNEDEETEETKSENCPIEGEDYDPNSMESLKKILSIQNSQVEELKKAQEAEFGGSRFSGNPRSILKSSFLKDPPKSSHKEKNVSKETRNFKRKLQSFAKEKSRRTRDKRRKEEDFDTS